MPRPCFVLYKGEKYSKDEFYDFLVSGDNHLDLYNQREQASQIEQEAPLEAISGTQEGAGVEMPTPPPTPPVTEGKEAKEPKEGKEREKTLLNRFLKSAKLSDKFKKHIEKYGTTYTSIPNEVTAEEADYLLASNGTQASEDMVRDTRNDLPARIRGLMGVRLISMLDSFADKAEEEGDMVSSARYRMRSVRLAEWLDKEVREWGRGVQVFASTEVDAALAPKSQVIKRKREMRRQRDDKIAKNKKDIDKKSADLRKINKDVADEALNSASVKKAKEQVAKTKEEDKGTTRKPTTQDKIRKEREYRKKQWDAFNKAKGTMSVSAIGLNSQQIEAIGNIVASYVREGITRTDDLIKKLQKDWFKNTGAILTDEDARKLLPKDVDGKTLDQIESEGEAEMLVSRIERMLKDPQAPKNDPVKQMIDTLFEKVQEKDPKEKVAREKKSDIDKIREALQNRDEYATIWEAAKERVALLIGSNPELSEEQKSEYNKRLSEFYNEVIGKPFSEKQAGGAVRKAIKDLGLEIDKIVRDHYTIYDAAKRTLQEKLIEELGLGEAEARLLADAVSKEFDKIAIAKKRSILQRGIRPREITQSKKTKVVWEKLIELTNMGAFSDAEFAEAYADAWGFPKLTEQQALELERLAKKIYNAPDGFQKYERVQDLLAYVAKIPGVDLGDLALGMWYANILSGSRTQFKNVLANTLNTLFELLTSVLANPLNTPRLIEGLVSGYIKGGYEFMHVLRNGYMPIRGFKIEAPLDLELKTFKGGGINPANWFKYVPRFMTAADAFSYAGLKEMRAYEIAMNEARRLNKEAEEPTFSTWAKATELLYNTSERHAEAKIQATQEGLNEFGKTKSDRNAYKRRVWEIMEQDRGQSFIEDAAHFAAHGTFNYPPEGLLGLLTEGISSFTNNVAVRHNLFGHQWTVRPVKFIIPFTRVISNVANEAMNYYTPVALARAVSGGVGFKYWEGGRYANKYRKYTPEEHKKIWIKFSMGVLAQVGLYLLTEPPEDDKERPYFEITGNGYGDYKKNYALKESGWQPYSIRIGNRWWSYQYSPLVLALAPLGFLRDTQKYKGDKYNEKDLLSLIGLSYYRSLRVLGDMTWATSVTGLMDAMNADNEGQAIAYLKNMASSTIKGVIYAKIAEQTVQFYDMAMQNPRKEANGIVGRVMRDLPVARNRYNDMLNAVGDPVMYDPIQMVSKEVSDPFWDFINDNNIDMGNPNKKDLVWDDINKVERGMTDDEYYDFIKASGPEIKRRIMEDVMPKNLTKEENKKESNKIKSDVRRKAKIEMFGWGTVRMSYPEDWLLMKKEGVVKVPFANPEVTMDDGKNVRLEEEMADEYNEIAMEEYRKRVVKYLSNKQRLAKHRASGRHPNTGKNTFDIEIDAMWSDARAEAEDRMYKKMKAEAKK